MIANAGHSAGSLQPGALLRHVFQTAVDAADPRLVLPRHLPAPPTGRTVIVGAGKAAAAMAIAVDQHWQGPLSGLVVTRHGQKLPCPRIEIVEAAHPVPDAAAPLAAARMLDAVRGLEADDLVICLISGGGSSLLTLPAPGLSLDDLRAVTRALLSCGAPIGEMNVVRKHLSAIAGGRLAAAAYPARTVTLAISDVPGDDPALIASGPTVADPSTFGEALEIVTRYSLNLPAAVTGYLHAAADETPKANDIRLSRSSFTLIATPHLALEAAAAEAREYVENVVILSDEIEGEASIVAKVHAGIARSTAKYGHPVAAPALILSGGETTVTVKGHGRGGRNSEFLLALALELGGHPGIHALACDTDGIDGSEDNAGAIIDPSTLRRATVAGLDLNAMLACNDAYGVFDRLGDLVVTGPTHTNVNDFRALLILT